MSRRIFGMLVALVLTFSGWSYGQGPAPSAPATDEMPANPNLPTLWIIGDSTANFRGKDGMGWGTAIVPMFDQLKVNVVNRAVSGQSSRTFLVQGHWDRVLSAMKSGDFLIIQLGHNDTGDVHNSNGMYSIYGISDESEDFRFKGKTETIRTYGWYLLKFVADARAKGAMAIIASPVPHCPSQAVKEGTVEKDFAQVRWSEQAAKSQNVPFISLHKLVLSRYVGMTPNDILTQYFSPPGDRTNTNPAGAALHAQCVVEGLKGLNDCALKDYLATK